MAIILDTSYLIALNNDKDIGHHLAKSLSPRIKTKEFGQVYISDYIFDELMTFLRVKSNPEPAIRKIGDALLADDSLTVLRIDTDSFLKSWELFKKSSGLSFTDCTIVVIAEAYGIRHIASLDSGFDRIASIKRIS